MREFDGASTREIHEHFDQAGEPAGSTVVWRESMWDDEARDRAIALTMFEDGVCSCCGLPVEKAYNPEQVFKVDKAVCHARRAIDKIERAEREKHKKADEGWDAGHHWYAVAVEDDRVRQNRGPRGD